MEGKSKGGYKYLKTKARQGFFSVLPAIVIVFAIQAYSIITVISKSFTNWDGMFKDDFIGLKNYVNLLSKGQFWQLLMNNILFLLYIPITLFLGLVVAVLLYQECAGWRFFRAVICLPQILSAVIIGYLLKVFFALDGPINLVLRGVGLGSLATNWLGNPATAIGVILFALVWSNIGWQAMIFTGGLSSIDHGIIEAAIIDGAGYWRRLFRVIVPMLGRVIEYSVITSVIFVFTGLYPLIFSITAGGPGYTTTTIDYMIYLKAFARGTDMGQACALAFLLLLIISVFTIIEMRVSNKMDDWS